MWIVIGYVVLELQRDFPFRGLILLCYLTLALDINMSSRHTVISLYG
jgi:hypothetical protein